MVSTEEEKGKKKQGLSTFYSVNTPSPGQESHRNNTPHIPSDSTISFQSKRGVKGTGRVIKGRGIKSSTSTGSDGGNVFFFNLFQTLSQNKAKKVVGFIPQPPIFY